MENNIEPTYCSFEISKLLKKKGFTTPCQHVVTKTEYHSSLGYTGEQTFSLEDSEEAIYNTNKEHYLAPQHWQVIQWLRVNHSISISITTSNNAKGFIYFAQIAYIKSDLYRVHTLKDENTDVLLSLGLMANTIFTTFEEAEEAAIVYSLTNLL